MVLTVESVMRSVMSLVKGLLMGLVMNRSWCQSHSDQMSQVQGPASNVFYFRVEFRVPSSSKKSECRVAIAVVDSVILDVIIISDITVILSRFDWILK